MNAFDHGNRHRQALALVTQESTDTASRRSIFGLVAGGLLALGLAGTQSASARRGGHGRNNRRGNNGRHGRRNNRNNRNNNR